MNRKREPACAERRLSLDYLTVHGATPVEQIEAAAAAGFDSVGLRFLAPTDLVLDTDVVGNPQAIRAIVRACRRLGVTPLDIEAFFIDPQTDLVRFARTADAAAEVGASTLLAVCADTERERAIDRFSALCEMVEPHGMTVALEFMRWSPVPTIQDAMAFVAATDRPNAGICVDALHLSRSGGSPAAIPNLPPGSFIQLCDASATIPPAHLLLREAREDRLYPGEGELWLDQLLDAVPPRTPVSVEVPHRRHVGRSVKERAALAGGALRWFLDRHVAHPRESFEA